jgi:hypothetical protein
VDDLRSRKRDKITAAARQHFWWRAMSETGLSMGQIIRLARMPYHHATVMDQVCRYCVIKGIPLPRNANWSRYRLYIAQSTRHDAVGQARRIAAKKAADQQSNIQGG